MAQSDLLHSLAIGTAPKHLRLLIARGLAPLPPRLMLQSLVSLLKDNDSDVSALALQTIKNWDEDDVIAQIKARDCEPSVLGHFAQTSTSEPVRQAIIMNPAAPGELIANLALTIPGHLLESILDNRVRILEFPEILTNIKRNPCITPGILRLVQEIETEFFGGKKREYAVQEPDKTATSVLSTTELEFDAPPEELTLEGLPVDPEARQAELITRLSSLSVPEKLRYALFGNREIRTMLIRDSNKEVARMVLRSPKLTDNEVEAIAAMRGVSEDILREIGNRKEFTKSYPVVLNLVKNPKTPPIISQRLLNRLRSQDLALLTRDRSIPEAVRNNATRTMSQRITARSPK
jgi:hypothetical protein